MAAEAEALRGALSSAHSALAEACSTFPGAVAARPPPRPGGPQLNPSAVFLAVHEFLAALRQCQSALFGGATK